MIGTEKQINQALQVKKDMEFNLLQWEIGLDNYEFVAVKRTMFGDKALNKAFIKYIDENKTDAEWYINKRFMVKDDSVISTRDFLQGLFDEIMKDEDKMKYIINAYESEE